MALHLVGETIDKARSHALAQAGRLVQLMRGIYVDTDDEVEATVLRHAVRIARYLYPRAYLSAASAILLGPTRDGRLFLSGRNARRTRLRTLEIVQNVAPAQPSTSPAFIKDGMGEFTIEVSSIRQRLLEAFRLRSEHAASLDHTMREEIARRLIEEYGTPETAAEAVWRLARDNTWYREGERAERFLLHRPTAIPVRNEAALDLTVAWHGAPVGRLTHDGFEWRWHGDTWGGPPLIRQTTPGALPPFILSLLPEGWLESVLHSSDERALLRSGKRYMSNITIVERPSELTALPADTLRTPLTRFTSNGVFTGHYTGPGRGPLQEGFERNLAAIFADSRTPRLSGIQIKAPMFLENDGTLLPSEGRPFTHILKPAGTGGFEALPLIEWQALSLGAAIGFDTPAMALVPMPDGLPPALLVERFDIRRNKDDTRLLALEDFCSVLGVPTSAKYNGTIERVARALRPLSTAPSDDILVLFRRALFAWCIGDGDMHLKNLALLKTSKPGNLGFDTVHMAPLYDAVTTRVFPHLAGDRMALTINGKDDRLDRADFMSLAATIGIRTADASRAIDDLTAALRTELDRLTFPAIVGESPMIDRATAMRDVIGDRVGTLA